MTDHLFLTNNVQDNATLTLEDGDSLTVIQNAGMYWTGASSIVSFAGNNTVSIFGVVRLSSITFGSGSVFVGAFGQIATSDTIISNADIFTNFGKVSTGLAELGVALQSDDSVLENYGEISGMCSVVLGNDFTSGHQLLNSGAIFGLDCAVKMAGGSEVVVNTGEISGLVTGMIVAGDDMALPTTQTVVNSGQIIGRDIGISATMGDGGSVLTLTNSGTITGALHSVLGGVEVDQITNTGTLNGNLALGGGNDVYNGLGGTLNGSVSGGTGADTYHTDDATLIIVETGSDTDAVFAATSFRLATLVENLTLLGNADYRGFGNSGVNLLQGNAGDNRLLGLDGNDTLYGDIGDDRLMGGGATDSLDGNDGEDTLLGGAGTDTVRGGEGDDRIDGGAGKDFLAGNLGLDVFVFSALAHSGNLTTTADIISDFTRGDDLIDLSALDANTTNATSADSFAFIGTAAFGNVAGQARVMQTGGNTYVELDVTGDSVADALIRISGLLTLTATDFLL